MSAFVARIRVLPSAFNLPHRGPIRSFHSPFVVLNATNPLTTTPPPNPTPVYEKQEDSSSEPHLSSSGTRTYVVSEPDPSDTPYEVPSGAYPASASYANYATASDPGGPYGPLSSTISHHATRTVLQHEAGVGTSAAVRSSETPGEAGRAKGGIHSEINFRLAAHTH